jgi:hypothetical protein
MEITKPGTARQGLTSNTGVDDEERQALRPEGREPDDPAVVAAIDPVRWELSLSYLSRCTRPTGARAPCPGHRVDGIMADQAKSPLAR